MSKNVLIVTILVLITKDVFSLNPVQNEQAPFKELNLRRLAELISRIAVTNLNSEGRAKSNGDSMRRSKSVLDLIKQNIDGGNRNILRAGNNHTDGNRHGINTNTGTNSIQEHAQVVEKELTSALNEKTSALMQHPYVENKGVNDFLVMKDGFSDPSVTVIPNAIYYDIEKKCVNWLDNCSLDGIRAKLFQVMRSPYR
nr:uncharacterized protein LOC128682997 isoform X2 [Plodia interpunctella]